MSDIDVVSLPDVYGTHREIPRTYVERKGVDDVFVDALSRKRHITIYGSSKQGKTCLRKHCLREDDYVDVICNNKWTLAHINQAILKKIGYTVEQGKSKSIEGNYKLGLKVTGEVSIPHLQKAGIEFTAEKGGKETASSTTQVKFEIDAGDANDVIAALKAINFKKFIILDDFHYLPIETQQDFAVALKAFHEMSDLTFIVVGVWKEENRLSLYNGDLTGRTIAVDADRWTREELERVILCGQKPLNITWDRSFVDTLLDRASESIYIVQEVCYRACERAKVFETQRLNHTIGAGFDVSQMIKDVVDEDGGRYRDVLHSFADGFQDTNYDMYRWVLYPVLTASAEDLDIGLRYKFIRERIDEKHPSAPVNAGNISQALKSVQNLQIKKAMKPFLFDYDSTNLRLRVVDRRFLLWLLNQDRNELLDAIDLPIA